MQEEMQQEEFTIYILNPMVFHFKYMLIGGERRWIKDGLRREREIPLIA